MNLYCEKRPSSIKTIGELRWYMFTKRQLESEKHPPTESAIRKKVMRSPMLQTFGYRQKSITWVI